MQAVGYEGRSCSCAGNGFPGAKKLQAIGLEGKRKKNEWKKS